MLAHPVERGDQRAITLGFVKSVCFAIGLRSVSKTISRMRGDKMQFYTSAQGWALHACAPATASCTDGICDLLGIAANWHVAGSFLIQLIQIKPKARSNQLLIL